MSSLDQDPVEERDILLLLKMLEDPRVMEKISKILTKEKKI